MSKRIIHDYNVYSYLKNLARGVFSGIIGINENLI
jgi:hypothetical protein